MTDFIFDPLLLTWAMPFFGWLSHEEYDYPDQYRACGGDSREEEEEGADPSPSGAQEGNEEGPRTAGTIIQERPTENTS